MLCSNLIRHFTASLSRMRRRLATSRDTFCNAPAAEPQTHGWLWWRSRMSHFIPPLRRMMRIESTSELTLCKAPTALAFTCITPHVNKTRASTRRKRMPLLGLSDSSIQVYKTIVMMNCQRILLNQAYIDGICSEELH